MAELKRSTNGYLNRQTGQDKSMPGECFSRNPWTVVPSILPFSNESLTGDPIDQIM